MIEAGGIGNAHHEGREIMKSTHQQGAEHGLDRSYWIWLGA